MFVSVPISVPGGIPLPSKTSWRLAALTVAAVSTAAGAVALSSPASADEVRVHDIQGATRLSPLAGKQVTEVPGIVTGVRAYGSSKGFWFQDPQADRDPATSEGIFVFTGSAPKVATGDAVRVSGTVTEYVPGGAESGNQSLTQISKPTVTVDSSGNPLPKAAVLDARSLPDRYAPRGEDSAEGSVNDLPLRPDRYALDRYESLEGMNVRIGTSRVVTATDAYAELWVTVKPHERPTARGGALYNGYAAQNTGRLQIQSLVPAAEQPFPTANVGDSLRGRTEGPLDYSQFGGYTLTARTLGTVEDKGLERERTRPQKDRELAVATYNVENLDPSDPQEKFDRLAEGVVEHLASPDIVTLEEIQDNSGAKDDGTVSAEETVRKFTAAIETKGGPRYEWRGIDPADKADGGEPGGNIRQVFLFNPERVSFTDRPGGTATSATEVVREHGKAALSASPGRVSPSAEAWKDSRKPLAGEFVFRGRTVFVLANHFSSKGGDQALHSQFQPPARVSEKQRHQQADEVNSFVKELLAVQKDARVIALGDINDFEFSGTTAHLEDGRALYSAIKSLPRNERYTYDYQGNSQVLDQILVSPKIRKDGFSYDSVHINAEFADQNSDHDPQVLRFRP
ncbi:large secreted protein [Streptomyces albus]|uniref:Large secreted protein n=1 Tax=Streptomyces albus (strain ATCC 21838 / DSM 41398 / FERM P-419 / JCM 4703 / NBRC 107858) TaxID=1081613 RepID=A0A0B5EU67_STRA4|nr:large secreted protein [Streptomyces albus]AOU80671.1 large secreted protein [Streptomyces albus]AYN36380.1 large secreted protein [Streptomyces albus]